MHLYRLGDYLILGDILDLISNNLIQILTTFITGIIGFLGIKIKKLIQNYVEEREKREIVDKTVKYIEQTGKDLSCNDKNRKAKEKSIKWLKEMKLSISDTELEILIESAVNCL